MNDRYEILFWHRVDGVLTLERKISRDTWAVASHIQQHYWYQRRPHGIIGIAIFDNGIADAMVGECGPYVEGPTFTPD